MKVSVTQKDIDEGTKRNCRKCPIAKALQRIIPNKDIIVEGSIIWIDNKVFLAPTKADAFVKAFDKGEKVKPISFVLKKDEGINRGKYINIIN